MYHLLNYLILILLIGLIILGDILADNLIINPSGRLTNKVAYEWSYASDSAPVNALYSSAYRVISRANLVLDNLNKVPSTAYMKNIEAEAKAIRAIAHFDIVRAYAKIPTQSADANSSLGIAYVTVFDPSIKPQRDATVEITYNKIITIQLPTLFMQCKRMIPIFSFKSWESNITFTIF